jgi:uncharacterized Tic20 family protein
MELKQERNWVVFCHLGGLITVLFLNIIIPLVIWLTQKNDSAFVDEQGKEIVNFQISLTIYGVVMAIIGIVGLVVASPVGIALSIVGLVVAFPAGIALYIVNVFSVIRGAIKASNGQAFLYPINLRLIK